MSDKDKQYIKETIESIKKFRRENKHQCVNTEHTFTDKEFFIIAKELRKRFKNFKVEFKTDIVEVQIPTFRRRI